MAGNQTKPLGVVSLAIPDHQVPSMKPHVKRKLPETPKHWVIAQLHYGWFVVSSSCEAPDTIILRKMHGLSLKWPAAGVDAGSAPLVGLGLHHHFPDGRTLEKSRVEPQE